MELDGNAGYGILIKQKDILQQRKYFQEMAKMIGVKTIYYAPRPDKHWTTYAEIKSNYFEPKIVDCIFETVADAKTTFTVEQSGTYNLFVRTRNWTAYWSDAPTPGVFEVFVDGVSVGIFGNENSEWHWQQGVALDLEVGVHTVVVHDLTGFDARFDALLFTTSATARPKICSTS